jgi:hypothetical protein
MPFLKQEAEAELFTTAGSRAATWKLYEPPAWDRAECRAQCFLSVLYAEERRMNQFIIPTNAPSGLQLYDPEKGLLALAAAEAAHKHFTRAKNLEGLTKAIEAKLKEQRNFVLWWDRMGEKRGSGPSQRCRRSETCF